MADLRQRIVLILKECLDLPRSEVTEIQEHAQRFLASIEAGDSPDADAGGENSNGFGRRSERCRLPSRGRTRPRPGSQKFKLDREIGDI